ncbi:MAG: Leu/Ile/Val-binding protein [Deltaproteobacteria bacterium]|jgi:branched-chain amino acid transport system substrate-binding protein|nr:Leu/Ile/Val-binding protein [Deltaproteobacteria bacterium]
MKIKKILLTALSLFFSFSLYAASTVKIGASMPLTGMFAVPGSKHLEGYQMCVDIINQNGGWLGKKVVLLGIDNRSDTETAISQYERFINVDKVDLVFGTFSSKLTFPTSTILAKYKYVLPIPSGGALRIYRRGFKNLFYFQSNPAEYYGKQLLAVVQDRASAADQPKTVALVHADDFFANSIANGLLGKKVKLPGSGKLVEDMAPGYIAQAGMKLVYHEQWPEEGFSDWLTLANSIKNSGAEMVIGMMASPEEAVQLTRALKTVRHNPKHLMLTQGTQSEFLEGLGDATEGIMIYSAWHDEAPFDGTLAGQRMNNSDFVAKYKALNGKLPDEDVAITFALCQGIDQAVIATGSVDNARIMSWLHTRSSRSPVKTILGDYYWDATGLPINKQALIVQWQGKELKFIYPTNEFQASSMVSPKPAW